VFLSGEKKSKMNLQNLTAVDGQKMPVFFIGHGSPMNAIEENEFSLEWQKIGKTIPVPKAILCISAHWQTKGTQVTAMKKPVTIHDFGGFPEQLYAVQYPAPGEPLLAETLKKSVISAEVILDQRWGLDHGAWSIFKHMYPDADIPVLEMSLDYYMTPKQHYSLAQELRHYREKGILIIGSGNMVHNLGMIAWDHSSDNEYGYDWAHNANNIFKKHILSGNHSELINFASLGRDVKLAIPTPEHFLPLLYSLALKTENEQISFFNDKAIMGSLTMTSLKIGN
jgi:4,5-DOPA dioxygenase extradiol